MNDLDILIRRADITSFTVLDIERLSTLTFARLINGASFDPTDYIKMPDFPVGYWKDQLTLGLFSNLFLKDLLKNY